jgi:hypothetical protein
LRIIKIYGKKYFIGFFILLCSSNSWSQHFFVSGFAGMSNYSGDLQEKRFTFIQAHPAFGLGLLFELNPKMLIRGDFTSGKISAHDKFGSKNKIRNLSFYSTLSEFSIGFEYTILNLYEYKVSPYLFTGIGLFDFNPYTKDQRGNVVFLAELNTEGQGFYDGRKDYKLREYSIPFGGGIQWAINDNKRIGIVVGFRKTFTDYIDDVSTTYVDEDILILNRGQNVANLAYRGDELPNGAPYPPGGSLRGNAKSKDWYYFSGLTYRMRLLPRKREWRYKFDLNRSAKPSIKCPTVF